MIKKVGNKSDETVAMENRIQEYFKREYNINLIPEYWLPNHNRVDFFAEICVNGIPEERIIVEIKRSVQDFYTGDGQNFDVDCNYLAVPSRLVGFAIAYLRNHCAHAWFIGILEVADSGFVREVIYPHTYYGQFALRRHQEMVVPYHYILTDPEWTKEHLVNCFSKNHFETQGLAAS